MRCLKCGERIPDGNVFCGHCMEQMAQHPVAPGTPILLPSRRSEAVKKPRKPEISEAEQIRRLQKRVSRLRRRSLFLVLLVIALIACLYAAIFTDLFSSRLPGGDSGESAVVTGQAD